jgi:Tol biopolymer transport system component
MPLSPGARVGAYEIVSLIGAGGMGEVYRARDTRLERSVAIKILPSQFAADPSLRDRFDREARAISSLNHPHICALYDVGEADTIRFLVLEYLEGETLAARLTRGALPLDLALQLAVEICDALDRAHRAGIIHRDLKPANVFLVRSGAASAPPVAKLLDFGLAKGAAPIVATSGLSMLPTTPPNLTAQGTILGTFQYMAPEQIEGLEADARTDIFAFGALLFEMLIGHPAFEGKTRASLLGAILKDEPPRVSALQPVPPMLDRVVATCLAKDPDDRYQTARDLLRDLKWIASGAHAMVTAPVLTSVRPSRAPWLVAAALGVALLASAVVVVRHAREQPPATSAMQFTVTPPDNMQFGGLPGGGTGVAPQLAVSPDGRNIVAVAGGPNGYQLWLRPFDGVAWRAIAGSEGSAFPFWSPDSRFVGFFAGGKLKKVQVSGGPPTSLCDVARGFGGTWNRNNLIVFASLDSSGGRLAPGVLMRVSANGGTPTATSVLDKTTGESHRWPQFLPDDRHFLYTAVIGTCCPAVKPAAIRIGAIDSSETVTLFQAESSVSYAGGYLLFWREGSLMAQRFDPATRRVTGDSFPITDRLATEGSRYASFSVSENGVLAYASGTSLAMTRLTWLDRAGAVAGTVGAPASYLYPALAPDDRHVAVSLAAGTPQSRAIWIFDLQRGAMSRLTFDAVDDTSPIWSPDGSRVAFQSVRKGEPSLRQTLVSGTAKDELLVAGSMVVPTDWSPDGRFITYNSLGGLWILPVDGDRKPFALARTSFTERNGAFSPDGRWIAYQSSEGGQQQIYVKPFPPTDRKYLVSIDGGEQPTWSGDGKELFFLAPDSRMMAATVDTTRQFEAGTPRALFVVPALGPSSFRQYAVSKDGKRFLMNLRDERATATTLTVVVNWLTTIQK